MKSRIRHSPISNITTADFFNGRLSFTFFFILASGLLIFSLVRPASLSGVRMGVTDMVTPVISMFTQPFTNAAEAIGSISGITALRAENTQLKAENVRLKEWYQTALMLQAENQSLQELLNLKVNMAHKYTTARVISDAGNAFVKTVLVSLGKNDGVKKNQAVLAGDGMVGRIIESGQKYSRVLLLNDINSRVPILIEGSRQKAVLAGDNSDDLILKHLPKDTGVAEGARVITSGHGGVFPSGLPIGRIVKNSEGRLVVKTYADMNKVTYVRVLDGSLDNRLIHGSTESLLQ